MRNRDIYKRDPGSGLLLNNGVAVVTDALTDEERNTLRFELKNFVCEGEYQRGLVRILTSYINNQGRPEQPAAWVSGFFGSGKSHFAKMLRFLWTDHTFSEDGATARGLARLPTEVYDLLKEVSTLGKHAGGLCAAAGTLESGHESIWLALLAIVFKSAGLPESYPQTRFCLWLRKNGIYDKVRATVEAEGRDFQYELNNMYVSPLIARGLLAADRNFASDEKKARDALRAQFPMRAEITKDEFIATLRDTLAPDGGEMPCTVVILDEVQQYIGNNIDRSFVVQEAVETCSKRFGDRLLFLGTGQTALSGTPALQRLQGRFTVNIELSDSDVETVIRRVVLAKRPDSINDIKAVLEDNAGELDRHLVGTKIAPRSEDKSVLVEDYPLLPVYRRFWKHILQAVDSTGTNSQLRTQLRIVYDAIRHTADEPLGTVIPADFLFEEISTNLLQSGVLLNEVNKTISDQDDGSPDGRLKSRLCALVFLIRKIPRDAGVDIGVRATPEMLADLLIKDLSGDGAVLRSRLPKLLEELVVSGTLMKIDDEYSLQSRESIEWMAEFRNRQTKLIGDLFGMSSKRAQLLNEAVQKSIGSVPLLHGRCKKPHKLDLHFGSEPPQGADLRISVWVRDGWSTNEKNVIADAREAGINSPVIHVFIPKSQAEALAQTIAKQFAARDTLEHRGVPSTPEGTEAHQGMNTQLTEAESSLRALVADLVDSSKVLQGGVSDPKKPCLIRLRKRQQLLLIDSFSNSKMPMTTAGTRSSLAHKRALNIPLKR